MDGDDDDEPSFFSYFDPDKIKPPPLGTDDDLTDPTSISRRSSDEDSFFASFSPKTAEEVRKRVAMSLAGEIIDRLQAEKGSRAAPNPEPALRPNVHGKIVVARVRPFSSDEKGSKVSRQRIVAVSPGNRLTLINPNLCQEDVDKVASVVSPTTSNETAKVFHFSHCLWSFDKSAEAIERQFYTQTKVYETIGRNMVENAVKGIPVCCFAYGHTGSGKTHTMFGSKSPGEYARLIGAPSANVSLTDDMGLIPRVMFDIASTLLRPTIKIQMSFAEIYNERIIDLLSDKADDGGILKVREHPTEGIFVEGLSKVEILSAEDAVRLVMKGHTKRAIGQTDSNMFSSRSHAIVTLEIIHPSDLDASSDRDPTSKASNIVRVQMTDLAGSEQDPTVGNDYMTVGSGKSFRAEDNVLKNERKFIRTSLSTLSFIIQALDKTSAKAPAKNLPYRDSLLTLLLREALTGSSCTTMVTTLSPAAEHYDETLLSLKYAQRLYSAGKKMRQVKSSFETAQELEVISAISSGEPSPVKPWQAKKVVVVEEEKRRRSMTVPARVAKEMATPSAESDFTATPVAVLNDATQQQQQQQQQYDQDRRVAEAEAYRDDEFRTLRGKVVGLEMELTNARTDRDSLAVELEETKRALVVAEAAQKEAGLTPPQSPKAGFEREREKLLDSIQAKDLRVETLLAELHAERNDRSDTEASAVRQIHKLMDRIAELQEQLSVSDAKLQQFKAGNGGPSSSDASILTALVEEQVRQVRLEADRRVALAEDAARTAQEALRMIMSMHAAK